MKEPRGKRSEASWSLSMMKKWFNIKSKKYECDEDRVDTDAERKETEREDKEDRDNDARYVEDMQRHDAEEEEEEEEEEDLPSTRQGNLSAESTCETSGTQSKRPLIKHRRGKSETLRAQYINTKDVRVTIGTWNVAGRPPHDDLEIDEWISMEEPSDIYILGFQEVVPLSAGNVLGVETTRPILQWESVIRRTLNRTIEPDPKPKSYSAPLSPVFPLSPVLRSSAADDDLLADVDGTSALELIPEELSNIGDADDSMIQKVDKITGVGKNFRFHRSYSIDSRLNWPEHPLNATSQLLPSGKKIFQRSHSNIGQISRLNWPERPLDVTSQVLPSSAKLRRVSSMSSSAGVRSDWVKNARNFSSQYNAAGQGRSGKIGVMWTNMEDQSKLCGSVADVLDLCPEVEGPSFEIPELEHEIALLEDGVKSRLKYIRIVSKQMVGIYISVWVRRRLRRHINNLSVLPVGVGLMGYMGNKGSVSVSMSVFQTRLCFVCSHLASGHKEGYEQRRNADVYEIIRRTQFSSAFDIHQPLTIPSHDQVFWFGDLNYRINMSDSRIRKLVSAKQWNELLNSDQLNNELHNGVFDGWKEGHINFPPTYKYGFNSDEYVGENRKEGEKKRSPAWCDRILWLGKGIKQLSYNRAEMWISDHRPVSSDFLITVEVFEHHKLQKALIVTSAVHPDDILEIEDLEVED